MSDFSTFFPSGGGGSGTIGAIASFVPDPTATFVAGQEVYTDPADSSVWLRSGATLTSAGSGVLDASIYRDSALGPIQLADPFANPYTFNGSPPATASCYIGNNKYITTTRSSNNYSQYNTVYDVSSGTFSVSANYSGVQFFDGQPGTGNGSAAAVGAGNITFPCMGTYNSTHHFLMGNGINYQNNYWREDTSGFFNIRYIPFTDTTNATNRDAYINNTLTFKSPFPAIPLQDYGMTTSGEFLGMAITNPSSNERHWFIKEGSVVTEYTFNSAAANNTNPYTATGNSITLPFTWGGFTPAPMEPRSMFALDNRLFFSYAAVALNNTGSIVNVFEYNATTRALVNSFSLTPYSLSPFWSPLAFLSIVPAANTGNTDQIWSGTINTTKVQAISLLDLIKGPFTEDSTYPEITAKTQRNAGTTFDAEQIYTNSSNKLLYTWLKIA